VASSLTIYSSLPAQTEELEHEWRATQDALGLYAYGKTADEASQRLTTALNLLVDTLMEQGGLQAVTGRLEQAGILFTVEEKGHNVRRKLPLMLSLAKTVDSPQ
jgi:hypothetical protein